MSTLLIGRGSAAALVFVAVVGLALPLFARTVLSAVDGNLIRRLLIYEILLALLGLLVAALLVLVVPGRSATAFSLGSLDVPVASVSWLGLGTSQGATWRRELVSMTLVITAVTATFVYFGTREEFSWPRAFENGVWILLFAALNAAGEEWLYRVALLRSAEHVLSANVACLLSAVVFGLAHIGGRPGGFAGALAAGVLGFVLSRATLETGGIAAAWCVHFVQDVVIFGGWLGAASTAVSPAPS